MLKTAILTLIVALWTTSAGAGACGLGDCATGAAGQGGVASDGKAQGFHTEAPASHTPGLYITNVGNNDAGHIVASGSSTGTLSGTYRNDIGRGHETGDFGDGSGHL